MTYPEVKFVTCLILFAMGYIFSWFFSPIKTLYRPFQLIKASMGLLFFMNLLDYFIGLVALGGFPWSLLLFIVGFLSRWLFPFLQKRFH